MIPFYKAAISNQKERVLVRGDDARTVVQALDLVMAGGASSGQESLQRLAQKQDSWRARAGPGMGAYITNGRDYSGSPINHNSPSCLQLNKC